MKHAIKSVVLGLSLVLANGNVAYAQDSQKAQQAYENGDYAIALKEWRLLAEQGNADAQYNLGEMYRNGEGVTEDYEEARKWYRLAAEQGNADAQNTLGQIMERSSDGDRQVYKEAVRWLRLAAMQGNTSAQDSLGAIYYEGNNIIPKDYK